MTYPSRFLKSTSPPAADASSANETVDSDFVVILAALLCALICVLGLVAVARCAWIRRLSGGVGGHSASHSSANKGLKKKVLRSLPKLTFSDDLASKLADCPICLSEFVAGDEIRVLPQCGHAFHVVCVDTWLGSHSSFPSCRQILAGWFPQHRTFKSAGNSSSEAESTMSNIKDPNCGKEAAAHFMEESELEESKVSSTDDENYQPSR